MYESTRGVISPKSSGVFEHAFAWGQPGLSWGGGATWGVSEVNAVIRQQLMQEGYPTSGVSTTPHELRAKVYALHGGTVASGFVFRLSVERLEQGAVRLFRVAQFVREPSVPEDDEYVLVPPNGGAIPVDAIIEILAVERIERAWLPSARYGMRAARAIIFGGPHKNAAVRLPQESSTLT